MAYSQKSHRFTLIRYVRMSYMKHSTGDEKKNLTERNITVNLEYTSRRYFHENERDEFLYIVKVDTQDAT